MSFLNKGRTVVLRQSTALEAENMMKQLRKVIAEAGVLAKASKSNRYFTPPCIRRDDWRREMAMKLYNKGVEQKLQLLLRKQQLR